MKLSVQAIREIGFPCMKCQQMARGESMVIKRDDAHPVGYHITHAEGMCPPPRRARHVRSLDELDRGRGALKRGDLSDMTNTEYADYQRTQEKLKRLFKKTGVKESAMPKTFLDVLRMRKARGEK
jgi:hypothetical protein